MELVFTRTGPRRYRVEAVREEAANLVLDPAPGFHDHVPHDLVHWFVECHWGLREGIYGQLAAGGDAHMFLEPGPRSRRRARRSAAKNRLSGADIPESERLAALTYAAWEARFGSGSRAYLDQLCAGVEVDRDALDRAAADLDVLARQWHALPVGGSLRLPWPWPERRTGRRQSAG